MRPTNPLTGIAPLTALLILGAALLPIGPAAAAAKRISSPKGRYLIHTNLTSTETRLYGRHMDAVFAEYQRRFEHLGGGGGETMPLYLFRTQQQFVGFLGSHGIRAQNTSGMFFVQPSVRGLATWTQGKSLSKTFAVLQHEGFHQFAHVYFGHGLPVWLNEGIAQYFEDGVFAKGKMELGIANGRRIETVRWALKNGKQIDFDDLLNMTDEQWKQRVVSGHESGSLLYAQSWSIVFFLIHGEKGRYKKAFEDYLRQVADGVRNDDAFRSAFRTSDTAPFRRRWVKFAMQVKPDALNTALRRMEFLGEGLRLLHERRTRPPKSLAALRGQLQRVSFHTIRQTHGFKEEASAANESVYRYTMANGARAQFQLLEASGADLPPRIVGRGLSPEPTLIWSRDAEGKLVQAFAYR